MGGGLLMLCYVMLVKCRRRYSSQNGLGLGGPALWVTARVVHPQVCPFGPQIGHAGHKLRLGGASYHESG